MKGVYIAFKPDWSSITPFSSEIEALKFAMANPGTEVGFAKFGESFGGKLVPAPKQRQTAQSNVDGAS